MSIIKRKGFKKIVWLAVILIGIGFLLNWYLAYRLENFLKDELSKRVTEATDGFYQLEYSDLKIGIWNGELQIDSVIFKPNPETFNRYMLGDSLPKTYLNFTLDKIHFKGINLVWRVSYRELNFSLFEIQKPQVTIYQSDSSDNQKQNTSQSDSTQTLHELIAPYIDVLTVEEINLTNATVTYYAGTDNDESRYQLQDVSFHAYGFRLDENSYTSGKLLYSDNFDFTTNRPQTLLSNNQLLFNTKNIYLSTIDSLIHIEKIDILPQRDLWTKQNLSVDSYIEATVNSLDVKGIKFRRENAQNYLDARNFEIGESNIQYFAVKQDSISSDTTSSETQPVTIQWTLFSVISPVLQSVSIDTIGIRDAKFAYTQISDDGTDLYSLNKFDFSAYDFRVDSLADLERRFLYSHNFSIDATGINGTLQSKNHVLTVEQMQLDTHEGNFDVRMIRLWPLDTHTNLDYIRGTIDSIKISEIVNEGGLRAKELTIDKPSVEYVRVPRNKKQERIDKTEQETDSVSGSEEVGELLLLLVDHLAVEKIYLNKGNLTYRYKQGKEDMIYKLPKIDFFADNVLLNQQTVRSSPSFVTYDNYGFKFENFDNLLPSKDYRLRIRNGVYTGLNGNLQLQDIALIPQQSSWENSPDSYLSFTSPSVEVKGIDYVLGTAPDKFGFGSVDIISPKLRMVKVRDSANGGTSSGNPRNPAIMLGKLNITDADAGYMDIRSQDSASFKVDEISLASLQLTDAQELSVGTITIGQPNFYYKKNSQNGNNGNSSQPASDNFLKGLKIGNWKITGLKVELDEPLLKLKSDIPSIDINNIICNSDRFSISDIMVSQPSLDMNQIINSAMLQGQQDDKNNEGGIYDRLKNISNEFTIAKFDVDNAQVNYRNTLNGKTTRQQEVNSTNLDFTGLNVDARKGNFSMDDFNFSTKNLNFPLDNGFYTLQIGDLNIHKHDRSLILNDLHLIPAYPKEEFAYYHPNHKDWFDVSVGSVKLTEIDYPTYFSNQILNIKDAQVNDVKLLNYKNQKIEIEHNIMPLIYEELQKAPIKLDIDNVDVHNFMVLYEELPENGDVAGKILFTEMNGKFTEFTNIVKRQNQYIRLDADAKFMGKGDFEAIWMLPVDSLNDRFLLLAHLRDFDLTDLNELIIPLASAQVNTGHVDSLILKTEATSKGAVVQMRLIYNDLDFSLLKKEDGENKTKGFLSGIANLIIKSNNPDKPGKGWREPYLSLERDPYHSTFNYLWQILQPPTVESVGVSQKTQNFFKGVSGFFQKVKNFFTGGSDKKDNNEKETKD